MVFDLCTVLLVSNCLCCREILICLAILISTAAFKSASSSSTGGGDDGRVICEERVDDDADDDRIVRLVLVSLTVDGVGVEIIVHWGSGILSLNGLVAGGGETSRSRV